VISGSVPGSSDKSTLLSLYLVFYGSKHVAHGPNESALWCELSWPTSHGSSIKELANNRFGWRFWFWAELNRQREHNLVTWRQELCLFAEAAWHSAGRSALPRSYTYIRRTIGDRYSMVFFEEIHMVTHRHEQSWLRTESQAMWVDCFSKAHPDCFSLVPKPGLACQIIRQKQAFAISKQYSQDEAVFRQAHAIIQLSKVRRRSPS